MYVDVSAAADAYVSDLSTVSSASLSVKLPDGTSATWATTIVSQSVGALRLKHTFDGPGAEVALAGWYCVTPFVTVPGGTFPCSSFRVYVSDPCG